MKKLFIGLLALSLAAFSGCASTEIQTPTTAPVSVATSVPEQTASPTPIPSVTPTATPTKIISPAPTAQQTQSPKSNNTNSGQSDKTEKTVYITKTGEKYHRSGCKYLRKSKISISLSSAKSRGYTPCSICNP